MRRTPLLNLAIKMLCPAFLICNCIAQIRESPNQLNARYGEPVEIQDSSRTYLQGNMNILAHFFQGQVDLLRFKKEKGGPKQAQTVLSEKEIKELLHFNLGDTDITVTTNNAGIWWSSLPKLAMATLKNDDHSFIIFSAEYLERAKNKEGHPLDSNPPIAGTNTTSNNEKYSASEKINNDRRFASIKSLAETGDVNAEFELACLYDQGKIVPKDDVQAFKWYYKAAEQGHVVSQGMVGSSYMGGKGVEKNIKEGEKWVRKADEKGEFSYEIGLEQYRRDHNDSTFIESLKRSAFYGHIKATLLLGSFYNDEKNPLHDFKQSFYWYQKASDNGSVDAQASLARMYYLGCGVEKDLGKAKNLFLKAAYHDNAYAQSSVGIMYFTGTGVPKDEIEGLAWVNIASAGDTNYVSSREFFEKQLGHPATLAAQQRSKEIQNSIVKDDS